MFNEMNNKKYFIPIFPAAFSTAPAIVSSIHPITAQQFHLLSFCLAHHKQQYSEMKTNKE